MPLSQLSNLLLLIGISMIIISLLVKFLPILGLPGDIIIQRKNFTFYFPIVTCVFISLFLTIILKFLK